MRSTGSDAQSLIAAANWLQGNLPIRFARRIEDFLQLPHVVVSNPSINNVLATYVETFDKISAFGPIQTTADEAAFCILIQDLFVKHGPGTRRLAEGYRELRATYPHIRLDSFLNPLFVARIASRILMENYIVMRQPRRGYVGVVRQGMRPFALLQDIAREMVDLTQSIYGCSTNVEYRGNLDCVLDYIPRHVSYMVRELLKNALRATVERHRGLCAVDSHVALPPVFVELQQGDIHVIIKISDHGGGMPKHVQQEAWQYGWTTAVSSNEEKPWLQDGARRELKSELAGFGFGLPLTRLHAQYFGGDVFMQALPHHGTDMYLLLTHLKEGTPSTEIEDMSTQLYESENQPRGPCITHTSAPAAI